MFQSAHPASRRSLPALLCALVTLLFLYNPFVAIPPSGNLTVHHNLSYRATIAASELQNYSPTDGSRIFAVAVILFFAWLLFSLDVPLRPLDRAADSGAFTSRLISASLWFRPPPAQ